MTRVIRKFYRDWKKCPSCNWPVSVLYSFTTNDIDEEGLCGDCFMDMLVECGYDVKSPPAQTTSSNQGASKQR